MVHSFSIVVTEKTDFWKLNAMRSKDAWRNDLNDYNFFYSGKSVWAISQEACGISIRESVHIQ